jgi:hypothetical protein
MDGQKKGEDRMNRDARRPLALAEQAEIGKKRSFFFFFGSAPFAPLREIQGRKRACSYVFASIFLPTRSGVRPPPKANQDEGDLT